jgi:hypothetical protein
VLLTRGRDGFFIFVPKEVGMETTYSALVGAGVREMKNIDYSPGIIEKGRLIKA